MHNWENFEIACVNYLRENFGDVAEFEECGGSDSTTPDILVKCAKGPRFYIEVKKSPAQSGQFVLLPNNERKVFEYSTQNNSKVNTFSQLTISHMNNDFDAYREAGTKGKAIPITAGDDVFSKWIKEYYGNKGVKFFITNNFNIIPIGNIERYFDIKATYRVKKSGSSAVGERNIIEIISFIKSNYSNVRISRDRGKIFATMSADLHNAKFILCGKEYMFSKRGEEYEIRKLSNTRNANVIFSIDYNNTVGISCSEFKQILC